MRPRRAFSIDGWLRAAVVGLVSLGWGPQLAGADSPPDEPTWEAGVLGYGWLSSITADLDAGPATVNLDLGIDELLPKLTWVVAGGIDARYERFVFLLNGLGQQVQTTENSPAKTLRFDPLGGRFGGLTASVGPSSASIRATEVMAEAAAGWRALSIPVSTLFTSVPADDPRRIRLDLLGGARYWYWRTEVRLSIPPATLNLANPPRLPERLPGFILGRLDLPQGISVGGSHAVLQTVASWTDALIGFRIGGDITRTLSLSLRTDIGGFGLGDSSDFTWQVMPGIEWRFADHWSAAVTYRAIGFDRKLVDNAILYGFLLGVGYRF
jgi:hypothetical protein